MACLHRIRLSRGSLGREIVEMPLCTCGIHFTTPRSRIAQLGDRSYIESLKRALESTPEEKIVFIGQSMFSLPLVLAKEMPHKSLHVLVSGVPDRERLQPTRVLRCLGWNLTDNVSRTRVRNLLKSLSSS